MFVDEVTRTADVPGEPGQWMKFRMLSFLEQEEAGVQGYIGMMRTVERMQEVEGPITRIFEAVEKAKQRLAEEADEEKSDESAEEASEPADPEVEEALAEAEDDPLKGMDVMTVLRFGIMAWSYERPVDEASIRLLDPDTAAWAAKQIVGIHTKDELEKSSAPSTQL